MPAPASYKNGKNSLYSGSVVKKIQNEFSLEMIQPATFWIFHHGIIVHEDGICNSSRIRKIGELSRASPNKLAKHLVNCICFFCWKGMDFSLN
jgi:hypothetical protein